MQHQRREINLAARDEEFRKMRTEPGVVFQKSAPGDPRERVPKYHTVGQTFKTTDGVGYCVCDGGQLVRTTKKESKKARKKRKRLERLKRKMR